MAAQNRLELSIDQILEVRTVSDEEFVASWAANNKISQDVVEKLCQEGFTSMEALKLIDRDDLSKTKLAIPKGQQKLVLAAVQKYIQREHGAQTAAAHALMQNVGHTVQSQATEQINMA